MIFRHKGCESPAIRYMGEEPGPEPQPLRSGDWQYPDGSRPRPNARAVVTCPDCGVTMSVGLDNLERLERLP
jgi:hypothetical protein